MKRDMDLIRQIMFKVEERPGGFAPQHLAIKGYTAEQIAYHVWLLGDAGLMRVEESTEWGGSGPGAFPLSLTWKGHDLIDAARNDTAWADAMEKAKTVGSVSLPVLQHLLDSWAEGKLGLR